jgi:DNA mismatch repair protein MutS
MPDLERLCGRLGMNKAGPRTLLAISGAITIAGSVKDHLKSCQSSLLQAVFKALPDLTEIDNIISRAIKDDAPLSITNGGIFNKGYSSKLDGLNDSIKDARAWIAGLAAAEREKTGIPSLKVGFNKVFGYYIEITKVHAEKAPQDYIRKQTLVNAERFITEEMKVKESLILDAEDKINRLEENLFHQLTDQVGVELPRLMSMADLLGELDLVNSLACLAREEKYVKPIMTDDRTLEIIQGRHPVLGQLLGPGNFVANDARLDDSDTLMIFSHK